ncbi:MAG: endopeptidase IV [Legionella sp.]|nr:MAG: endopeptidase IV [Legionella sp.]
MNKIITTVVPLSLLLLGAWSLPLHAAKEGSPAAAADQREIKDNHRFPTGCRPVGYKEALKIITLYPGKEGALQSMFFFYNQRAEPVSLYQMNDKISAYSTRFNHTIRGNAWAVLATGEPEVKFICSLGDGKKDYGQILDCAETIKICEYVNVKFGLNNKGNFWIVDGNTRNGAVNEVVRYGIIPGV